MSSTLKITVNRKPFHGKDFIKKNMKIRYTSQSKKEIECHIQNQISNELQLIRAQSQKMSKIKYEYLKLSQKMKEEIEQFNIQKEKEMKELQQWKNEQIKKIRLSYSKKKPTHSRQLSYTQSNNINTIKASPDLNSLKNNSIINALKIKLIQAQNELNQKDKNDRITINTLKEKLKQARNKLERIKREKSFNTSHTISDISQIKKTISKPKISIYDMSIPKKYSQNTQDLVKSKQKEKNGDISITYTNNTKEHIYHTGIKKVIYSDGYQVIYFQNGDVKQIYPNNYKTIYYYSKEKMYMMFFGKNESEKIFKYEDGTIVKEYENGKREYIKEKDISEYSTSGFKENTSSNNNSNISINKVEHIMTDF